MTTRYPCECRWCWLSCTVSPCADSPVSWAPKGELLLSTSPPCVLLHRPFTLPSPQAPISLHNVPAQEFNPGQTVYLQKYGFCYFSSARDNTHLTPPLQGPLMPDRSRKPLQQLRDLKQDLVPFTVSSSCFSNGLSRKRLGCFFLPVFLKSFFSLMLKIYKSTIILFFQKNKLFHFKTGLGEKNIARPKV